MMMYPINLHGSIRRGFGRGERRTGGGGGRGLLEAAQAREGLVRSLLEH